MNFIGRLLRSLLAHASKKIRENLVGAVLLFLAAVLLVGVSARFLYISRDS